MPDHRVPCRGTNPLSRGPADVPGVGDSRALPGDPPHLPPLRRGFLFPLKGGEGILRTAGAEENMDNLDWGAM